MLEELSKEKQRFDEKWDAFSRPAIETIKLEKRGNQNPYLIYRRGATPEISPAQNAGLVVRK